MSVYLFPLETALIMFPVLALMLTLPYVLWTFHRYGAVSFLRSAILFSFFFYLLCAYFLVILPLPDPATVEHAKGPFTQLRPLEFVRVFLEKTPLRFSDPSTYLPALRHTSFFQPMFNLLLTVPFGAYMSYYFRQSLPRTILWTFLLSLFFELTQLTGLYGIYAHPYRLFDVDDLLLNTLGGLVGYGLGHVIARILPSRRHIDRQSYLRSRTVSYTRRLVAITLDILVLTALVSLVSFVVSSHALWPVMYFLYFVGLQSMLHGRTPGKAFVRLHIAPVDSARPLPLLLLYRYGLLYGYVLLFDGATGQFPIGGNIISSICVIALPVMGLYTLVDLVRSRNRDKRLWYERLSHTRNRSDFEEKLPI